jgi:hypothetical protein
LNGFEVGEGVDGEGECPEAVTMTLVGGALNLFEVVGDAVQILFQLRGVEEMEAS